MSHLSRRYTNYFYTVEGKGRHARLVKTAYLTRQQFIEKFPMTPLPPASGMFPCEHERRDFLPKNGKHVNRTKARMKRRNKARIRARKAA